MIDDLLVVAATSAELTWADGVAETFVCGIGPVEAAAATATRLAVGAPARVVHVGLAGGAPVLGLVVGTRAVYRDLRAAIPVQREVLPDAPLLAAVCRVLPEAVACEIATTASVGSTDGPVEAMEGFGVLRACSLAGIPAVEVRAISNALGESDRAAWDIPGALGVLADAGLRLLRQLG